LTAPLVVLGGAGAEAAAPVFRAALPDVRVLGADPAAELAALDGQGVTYTLVHIGPDDGRPGGSHERAHHRISLDEAAALATQLRPRERPLVTCLAFGYKNGLPPDANWLVDVRFLDNPYWVPELRERSGRDPAVADFVLRQEAAVELADRLEAALRWAIPLYQRDHLVVAFGCTGGRHRSVVLAEEMARRLSAIEGIDVEFVARDL